ncbi:MAG: carbohydrate kinase family protein [Lachnospiraceae bacterium]|nr:carbohydrate kinase family protein [Ruminococcus sp.]MCM1274023.1 carbohydrate kinase family protein [Lachnospiraceae bacterium]
MEKYIYMYGQVMSTEAFLLKGEFPEADGYCEIKEKYHHVGGETGTAAAVLASLGCNVKLGGSHIGNTNRNIIRGYFADKQADLSELADENFDGIVDYVLIDKTTRTCFGEWEKHFGREKPFYEPPCEESIKNAECCGIDPFFHAEISAELCRKYNKPYATIDCAYDSDIHKYCAVNAVSHQHLESRYPDKSFDELFKLYTDGTDGLVIFTMGEKELMYGRKGQLPKRFMPYPVDVVSTLGAGDSFKAGVIYALFNKMSDDDTVKFASAVAGIACTKFPIPLNPPTLSEVKALTETRNDK